MTFEDIYGHEWAAFAEAENAAYLADKKRKDKYKKQLSKLLNTRRVWEYLNDQMDNWKIEDVVFLKIYRSHNSYYNKVMNHAKCIVGENANIEMHRQSESKSEMGVSHIFIKQWTHYEDNYTGIIAFPLKDYRYLLISYVA